MHILSTIKAETIKAETIKVGIWGFGIVGKSVIQFLLLVHKHIFKNRTIVLELYDQRKLTKIERQFLKEKNITIITHKKQFLECNDLIIPSPGVNLDAVYTRYRSKWVTELDLFYKVWSSKIIAITGSIGKTSTTKLLSDILLAHKMPFIMGGNIGIGCLDLVYKQSNDIKPIYALLEISSFQLNYTQEFAPDLAILTNIYPNHLDWHGNEEAYFQAKCRVFSRQTKHQQALMPLCLKKRIEASYTIKSRCAYFSSTKPSDQELETLSAHEIIFYIDTDATGATVIVCVKNKIATTLISLDKLPPVTFTANWLTICSALYLMDISLDNLPVIASQLSIPEHRLERWRTWREITIYNDSKATTGASTAAAVHQLREHPIILILGGLSKGVSREPFIRELKDKVKQIYVFGSEAEELAAFCNTYHIPVLVSESFEHVVIASMHSAVSGDQILFSPAGSSYDMFTDYEQRGRYFKHCVNQYIQIHESIRITKKYVSMDLKNL